MSAKKLKYAKACDEVLDFYNKNVTSFLSAKPTKPQYFVLAPNLREFSQDIEIKTYNSKGEVEKTTNINGKIAKFVPSSYNSEKNTLDIYSNDISVLDKMSFKETINFSNEIKNYLDKVFINYVVIEGRFSNPPTRKYIDVKELFPNGKSSFDAPFGPQNINENYYIALEEERIITIEGKDYPWIVAVDKKSFHELYEVDTISLNRKAAGILFAPGNMNDNSKKAVDFMFQNPEGEGKLSYAEMRMRFG